MSLRSRSPRNGGRPPRWGPREHLCAAKHQLSSGQTERGNAVSTQADGRLARAVDVLVVADGEDPHAQVILSELESLGASAVRHNLNDLRQHLFLFHPGELELECDHARILIANRTSVWWRRVGWVDVADLDSDEATLANEEAFHIFRGSLLGSGVRWVDEPLTVDRADSKGCQLRVAAQLGIAAPATLVTNDRQAAQLFARNRRLIGKASSPGIGITPYVALLAEDDLGAVETLPVMLQEFVPATADLRVVVIGRRAWTWRRPREEGLVDWRQLDPSGLGFRPADNEEVARQSIEIAARLGLTMAVQDWLQTPDGPVFLESNAQGSWLFLQDSRDTVAPDLARHLLVAP